MAGPAPRRTIVALLAVALLVVAPSLVHATERPRVTEIEVEGEQPWEVVGLGRTLVGPAHWESEALRAGATLWPPRVLVSNDARRWRSTPLPGAPPGVQMPTDGIRRVGRTAVTSGVVEGADRNELYVWTSRDGVSWRGGLVTTAPRPAYAPAVVGAKGTLLFATRGEAGHIMIHRSRDGASWSAGSVEDVGVSGGDSPTLEQLWTDEGDLVGLLTFNDNERPSPVQIRSRDGGATWRHEACPATPKHCGLRLAARGLELRGLHASTDRGGSWQRIRFRPALRDAEGVPTLKHLRRVDGGWLLTLRYSRHQESFQELVLRSADGRTWHRILPRNDCVHRSASSENSELSPPRRLDGHWYITYRCSFWSDGVRDDNVSWIYVSDRAGVHWDQLRGGRSAVPINDLVRFRGTLLATMRPSYPLVGDTVIGFFAIDPR
jgi:hypothetical protein